MDKLSITARLLICRALSVHKKVAFYWTDPHNYLYMKDNETVTSANCTSCLKRCLFRDLTHKNTHANGIVGNIKGCCEAVKTYYSRISCKKLFLLKRKSFRAYSPKIGEILRKCIFFPKKTFTVWVERGTKNNELWCHTFYRELWNELMRHFSQCASTQHWFMVLNFPAALLHQHKHQQWSTQKAA